MIGASATEVALRAVGTALAALSAGFAVYMLAYGDHRPHIYGLQYLGIFAQPRGALSAKAPEAPLVLPPVVDMASTGSFTPPAPPEQPPSSRPPQLVAAQAGKAWILVDGAIRSAAPGDDVPHVGRVARIVEREDGWALLDENGAMLLKLSRNANGAALFGRKMIFQ